MFETEKYMVTNECKKDKRIEDSESKGEVERRDIYSDMGELRN